MKTVWVPLVMALVAMGCASGGSEETRAAAVGGKAAEVSAASSSLAGTSWIAEDIGGHGVAASVVSTVTFERDGSVNGRAACNRYFGTARFSGDRLEVKPDGMTRMACPPGVMDQEARFLAALAGTAGFRSEDGKLLLLDNAGATLVRLAPLPAGVKP